MKAFWIEYYFPENPDDVKVYVTDASSRKEAESKVRGLESPDKINIKKIDRFIDTEEAILE